MNVDRAYHLVSEHHITWSVEILHTDTHLFLSYVRYGSGKILIEQLPYEENPELRALHDGESWNESEVNNFLCAGMFGFEETIMLPITGKAT